MTDINPLLETSKRIVGHEFFNLSYSNKKLACMLQLRLRFNKKLHDEKMRTPEERRQIKNQERERIRANMEEIYRREPIVRYEQIRYRELSVEEVQVRENKKFIKLLKTYLMIFQIYSGCLTIIVIFLSIKISKII